ncbi:MAG TPA: murein L,D-transpeptidase catalytic domain family protein [Rhodanobacteraceae bacterium]|nr:murein L,D-transpeptidase catalytic domain family protein [Rhodanobacteraceae bacterium]
MHCRSFALLAALALPGAVQSVTNPHAAAAPSQSTAPSASDLARLAPAADPKVLELALSAMHCAQGEGVGPEATRLAVIDYSRSSLQPRLWVFDLKSDKLLYEEVVAHGQGSGGDVPDKFSNDDGSHASSLGLFVTRDTYVGHNGYSLRMEGLEQGINDAALSRAIVMHGAAYVNPEAGKHMGRLGRSWGCPALRAAIAKPIIDVLKDGQFVFSYYPDQHWLTRSALLKCPASGLARHDTHAHDDSA